MALYPIGLGSPGEFSFADPPLGSAKSILNPTRRIVRVVYVSFLLTTDATVINRRPILQLTTTAGTTTLAISTLVQGASLARTWTFAAGHPSDFADAATGAYVISLLPECWHLPNSTLRTDATDLQAGDQISNWKYLITEWIIA